MSRFAASCAGIAAALAALALLGYFLGVPALYRVTGHLQAMAPLTAVALLVLAISEFRTITRKPVSSALLLVPGLIGFAALASHLFVGNDALSPRLASLILNPGAAGSHTSIATALCLMLITGGHSQRSSRLAWISDACAAVTLLISGTAILGYAYGAEDLYRLAVFRTMAINTAAGVFLIALSMATSRRDHGWAAIIGSDGEAGAATRRQLCFALVPVTLGFVMVKAVRTDALPIGGAMALLVMLTVVPLVWLVLRDGRALALVAVERGRREIAEARHLVILEARLDEQAAELAESNAERISLAERASQRSDDRYRRLFNSIDVAFCVVEMGSDDEGRSVDYRFVEMNAAFGARTGLANAEGQWMRTLAPNHEQHWFDTYGEVARTGAPVRFELSADALEGRWYDVHAFQVDDSALHRVGILFSDVTESRRTRQALEELNRTLEQRVAQEVSERESVQEALQQSQKMEAIGQLTGGVAHDFNNLLTPIIGSLDLLSRKPTNTERESRLINGALQSAERAKTVVQRLLAFARRQPLQIVPVDIGALVHSMAALIVSTIGSQIQVCVDVEESLPLARADLNQVEMALLNLCVNARDAMPEGGQLTVRATAAAPPVEENLLAGDYIRLSVVDTGIGMDAATISKATEPFFSTKETGRGTGLACPWRTD